MDSSQEGTSWWASTSRSIRSRTMFLFFSLKKDVARPKNSISQVQGSHKSQKLQLKLTVVCCFLPPTLHITDLLCQSKFVTHPGFPHVQFYRFYVHTPQCHLADQSSLRVGHFEYPILLQPPVNIQYVYQLTILIFN